MVQGLVWKTDPHPPCVNDKENSEKRGQRSFPQLTVPSLAILFWLHLKKNEFHTIASWPHSRGIVGLLVEHFAWPGTHAVHRNHSRMPAPLPRMLCLRR